MAARGGGRGKGARKRGARGGGARRRGARRPAKARAARALGPFSLERAEALVRGQQAVTAPLQRQKASLLRRLGRERRELDRKRRAQIRERRQAYDAACRQLEARGVEAAGAPPARGAPEAAARVLPPLRILAEGDSWFDYPVPGFGGGVIPRLATRLGVPIHNLAQAGDEVRYMLGVEQRQELAEELQRMSDRGTPYDVLLFSGGGNDIVGDPLCLWIRGFDPGLPPAQHVHTARFDAALALVRAGYEDLVAIRDAASPATRVLVHPYDFALPDGRGVCFYGPWLEPSFAFRRFPKTPVGDAAAAAAVAEMLARFRAVLAQLAAAHAGVTLVETQGTLHGTADWHNELHPSKGGFDAIVEVFRAQLAALFPGRIPA
jgi:hypothetical protein